MKLYYSPTSPYVRKVSITAEVTGLADSIERISSTPHPINRDQAIVAQNPLGKAPTLVTNDGLVLYDSRVIVEYLDTYATRDHVLPPAGDARWRVLTLQALGDGILDAALLIRYEGVTRPPELQSDAWRNGQMSKITDGLDRLEHEASSLGHDLDIGNIAIDCALGFLSFRMPELDWQSSRPHLAAWFEHFDNLPLVAATRPKA